MGLSEMKQKKVDRRVEYTKMLLKQSLLELLKEQPIEKITVTSLCGHADINRNTFYKHFATPYDLLREIQDKVLDDLRILQEQYVDQKTPPTLGACNYMLSHRELCTSLFSENCDQKFLRQLMCSAHDTIIRDWDRLSKNANTEFFEKAYVFFQNGSLAIIQQWIQGGMQESPEEIAKFIDNISNYGLYYFFRENGSINEW
jgi:AcrR family transcriptional regulator